MTAQPVGQFQQRSRRGVEAPHFAAASSCVIGDDHADSHALLVYVDSAAARMNHFHGSLPAGGRTDAMANAILFCVLPGFAGRDSHGFRRRPGHPIMRARGSIGHRPQSRPTAVLAYLMRPFSSARVRALGDHPFLSWMSPISGSPGSCAVHLLLLLKRLESRSPKPSDGVSRAGRTSCVTHSHLVRSRPLAISSEKMSPYSWLSKRSLPLGGSP